MGLLHRMVALLKDNRVAPLEDNIDAALSKERGVRREER